MNPRDQIEVPWENPPGRREWRRATILCVMPRLLIVEYADGKRHCLPKEHVRMTTETIPVGFKFGL